VKTPAILDEAQHVPEVFAFVRSRIDRQPRRTGQRPLTGSPEAPLMQGVTKSMAGRAAVLQIFPNNSAPLSSSGQAHGRGLRPGLQVLLLSRPADENHGNPPPAWPLRRRDNADVEGYGVCISGPPTR
jgi:AAA domain